MLHMYSAFPIHETSLENEVFLSVGNNNKNQNKAAFLTLVAFVFLVLGIHKLCLK
jgi:hypothetical protein